MNKELFDSMREQMAPSPQVRATLSEKLSVKKRPVPWKKYGAVAACAALVVGSLGVYNLYQDKEKWTLITRGFQRDVEVQHLHSYVLVDGLTGYVTENTAATQNETTAVAGGGGLETGSDRDQEMTVYDMEEALLEVGYTPDEVKEYESIGYQMTWAKWWKFVGQQRDSGGGEPFTLDALKEFSQEELFINTGVLPGGAYIGDVPSQEEAVNAYQALMDHFGGKYPDWYGGAYIDNSGTLVVCLVRDKDPGDKTLELKVLDITHNGRVAFSEVKYSLAYLTNLMDQLNQLPEQYPACRKVMAAWGVDEEANYIEMTLTEINDEVLSILAQLDPDDDAIYVQIGQRPTAADDLGEDVSHSTRQSIQPGGVPAPDDEDLIADEPYVDPERAVSATVEDLPAKLPGVVQSVPEEDTSSSYTAAYDPDVGFIYPKN